MDLIQKKNHRFAGLLTGTLDNVADILDACHHRAEGFQVGVRGACQYFRQGGFANAWRAP